MYFVNRKLVPIPTVSNEVYKKVTINRTSKTNYRSFFNNCTICFANYSKATTIHGVKYLAERGRSITERTCWAIAMVASFFICTSLIVNIYQKWVASPVIVTFANNETIISEIPLPAMTFCPEVKSNTSLFNYTDAYLKIKLNRTITSKEKKYFEYMSLICQTPQELLNDTQQVADEEALDFILKVSPHPKDFISGIKWMGYSFTSGGTELFRKVLTDEGLCYTFNMMRLTELFTDIVKYPGDLFWPNWTSDWFPDTGYLKHATLGSYPFRSSSAGADGGFTFTLKFDREQFDYICNNGLQGYKIALHHPAEFPLVKENYFRLSPDHAVIVAVKPNVMTTSLDLEEYKAQDRKCYFMLERKLKFFRIYTQQNCLVECLANLTLNMCGCVNFYMPREATTRICAASRKTCMAQAEEIGYIDECDCLSSCYSIKFDIETSATKFDFKEKLFVHYQMNDVKDEKLYVLFTTGRFGLANVLLFYKDRLFLRSERNILYSQADFWAQVGGILGLFTGFSFISLCEILYFITLRIIYNAKQYGCRYWASPPENI